jgi:hypothetical protein
MPLAKADGFGRRAAAPEARETGPDQIDGTPIG